jgi:hypothetical protein
VRIAASAHAIDRRTIKALVELHAMKNWMSWLPMVGVLFLSVLARADDSSPPPEAAVELFAAIDGGLIEVTVIPGDASRLTMQIANKSDQPLSIQLPPALAAMPVLAQLGFGLGNQGFGNNVGGGNGAPQGLGAGLGGPGGFNNNGGPGGFFNVPPGKIIRRKLPSVCLEFGKPDPRPQHAYRVAPLDSLNDRPAVAELLQTLGTHRGDHTVMQLAAWHLANDMSWQQLAGLRHREANGRTRPRFSTEQLEQAQALVAALPSVRRSTEPTSESASRLTAR